MRTLSELCITSGAVVLVLVACLLWTGVRADSAMDREIGRLEDGRPGHRPGAGEVRLRGARSLSHAHHLHPEWGHSHRLIVWGAF
jgi:sortase A